MSELQRLIEILKARAMIDRLIERFHIQLAWARNGDKKGRLDHSYVSTVESAYDFLREIQVRSFHVHDSALNICMGEGYTTEQLDRLIQMVRVVALDTNVNFDVLGDFLSSAGIAYDQRAYAHHRRLLGVERRDLRNQIRDLTHQMGNEVD